MRVIADFINPAKVEFYCKGLYIALADPQEFLKEHMMENNETPSFAKRCFVHFAEISTL